MSKRQLLKSSSAASHSKGNNIKHREEEFAVGKYRQDPLQQHPQKLSPQTRAQRRPNTAGAGTGGVPGVLARLGGYEKSGFREFGGDGEGRVVEKQLAQDTALLDDLRGTLYNVLTWDHTHGVPETGGGGGGGGNPDKGGGCGSQDKPALGDPTATADRPRPATADLPAEEQAAPGLVVPETDETQSRQEERPLVLPAAAAAARANRGHTSGDNSDKELAGHQLLIAANHQQLPSNGIHSSGGSVLRSNSSVLSRISPENADDANDENAADDANGVNIMVDNNLPVGFGPREDEVDEPSAGRDIGSAVSNRPPREVRTSEYHNSRGGGPEDGDVVSVGSGSAPDVDVTAGSRPCRDIVGDRSSEVGSGGSATTASSTLKNSGSCGEWVRRQKRTHPVALTDDERMSMLHHVKPSVFGEPAAVCRRLQPSAAAAARPRSAADAQRGGVSRHISNHAMTRACRRSRQGELLGRNCDTRKDAFFSKHHQAVLGRSNQDTKKDAFVSKRFQGEPSRNYDTRKKTLYFAKHQGVLVHDGWLGEDEPARRKIPMTMTSSSSQPGNLVRESPRGSRRRGNDGGGGGGGGGRRPQSFVNSVAFGVNMGVLDSLSDTTASATAAAAYAYAAGGVAAPSSAAAPTSRRRSAGVERGQSAPPQRRPDNSSSSRTEIVMSSTRRRWTPAREHQTAPGRN